MQNGSAIHSLRPGLHFSRRELMSYAFILMLGLVAAAFIMLTLQMIGNRPDYVDLGAADEFSTETPNPVAVNLQHGQTLHLWLVNLGGEWIAFEGHTPVRGTNCLYQWQPVSHRFEDPCTGAKYSLAGEFSDPYGCWSAYLVQNLNRYRVTIKDGQLWIDTSTLIPGAAVHPESRRACP